MKNYILILALLFNQLAFSAAAALKFENGYEPVKKNIPDYGRIALSDGEGPRTYIYHIYRDKNNNIEAILFITVKHAGLSAISFITRENNPKFSSMAQEIFQYDDLGYTNQKRGISIIQIIANYNPYSTVFESDINIQNRKLDFSLKDINNQRGSVEETRIYSIEWDQYNQNKIKYIIIHFINSKDYANTVVLTKKQHGLLIKDQSKKLEAIEAKINLLDNKINHAQRSKAIWDILDKYSFEYVPLLGNNPPQANQTFDNETAQKSFDILKDDYLPAAVAGIVAEYLDENVNPTKKLKTEQVVKQKG